MSLLAVSHYKQRQQADCLAACAAMVLEYLHVSISYERLLRLLSVRSYGTSFSSLRKLESVGLSVLITRGDLASLRRHLEGGSPVIVAVNTAPLPHWDDDTAHAVVVVGLEQDVVLINDPEFEQAPRAVPLNAFLLGWLEHDYRYAVLKPARAT
jgi:ABC-type bacteriocin/lantibiotic exporter with double-glycine peptidase domain